MSSKRKFDEIEDEIVPFDSVAISTHGDPLEDEAIAMEPIEQDGAMAATSTGGGSGGMDSAAGGDSMGEYIPGHSYQRIKKYTFSTTRALYFDSTDNAVTISDVDVVNEAPFGYPDGNSGTTTVTQPNWNGELTTGWKIIPTNMSDFYMQPTDVNKLYADDGYEWKVNSVHIKGYDAVMVQESAQSTTYNTSVDKPMFMEFKDKNHVYQNQGYLFTTASMPKECYTPNIRPGNHEFQGENLGNHIPLLDHKYWIPGPNANWNTNAELLNYMYPQPERVGGINLVKPGHDIEYHHKLGNIWRPLYDTKGEAMFSYASSATLDAPRDYFESNYHQVPRLAGTGTSLTGGIPDIDLRQNRESPIPTWLVRIPQFESISGGVTSSRIYMLFDYTIEVEVKCRANHHLPGAPNITWNLGGYPDPAGFDPAYTTNYIHHKATLSDRTTGRKFTRTYDANHNAIQGAEKQP